MESESRIMFNKAIVYGDVKTLEEMVKNGKLIVTRRHVKLAKKYRDKCSTSETACNYYNTIHYLKSQCKCSYFL